MGAKAPPRNHPMNTLPLLTLGFLLGMRHATDADHVVAVTTIVGRERSVAGAARMGLLWGAGHTLTVLAFGGAIVALGLRVPPRLGLALEGAVAIMLVVLGLPSLVAALRRLRARRVHAHAHVHADGCEHEHPHLHEAEAVDKEREPDGAHSVAPRRHARAHGVHGHAHGVHGDGHREHAHDHRHDAWEAALDGRWGDSRLYRAVRPLVVGVVHGLAGSAAVALLVLTTVDHGLDAFLYLALFGAGTIAGMMLVTAALAVPLAAAARRAGGAARLLGVAAGFASVAFGVALAYQVTVVDGLFAAAPTWTPH